MRTLIRNINLTIFFPALAFLSMGCSTTLKRPIVEIPPKGTPIQAYSRVLDKYVNDRGQVDFKGIQNNPTDLYYYLDFIAQKPLTELGDDQEKLSHTINAYNALSIYTVLEKDIPKTNSGLRKVFFFYLTKMNVGGEIMSLYHFENEIIRKMGEEKIHFALNCMAAGCPRLPKRPFSAKRIKEELEREAKFFFNEERNVRVDHGEKTVYLSEILDFFTEDFVPKKAKSLIAYANKYRKDSIPLSYKVKFIPYDWTINNYN